MAKVLRVSGRMSVGRFEKEFEDEFGVKCQIKQGRNLADDNATLASLRPDEITLGALREGRVKKVTTQKQDKPVKTGEISVQEELEETTLSDEQIAEFKEQEAEAEDSDDLTNIANSIADEDYLGDKEWSSDLRKAANKGKLGQADKILFRGLYYDYAEECFSKDDLVEKIKSAIENEVTLSDFFLDGFYACDFGVERYPDDTYFCTGASGELVVEDLAENIITSLSTEDIKTSKSEKKWSDIYPEKLCDTFRITFEDGFRGEWRKYKLNHAQIKSFDLSLLSFSVLDDGDISLDKLMYGDVELEDYDEINDARGKSTIIDLEYFDKDGNREVLDIDMDPKELLIIIKSK